ncbi:MAG: alpha/beta fold hydrolase [Pseudomonadota bacterium]
MPEGLGPEDMLAFWQSGQQAFWTAAAEGADFADASSFAEADWQAFDSALAPLLEAADAAQADGWAEAVRAGQAYRDVITATFRRIAHAFDIQRRALAGSSASIDWRLLRDRWFAIAEVEFIETLRSEAFLKAQRAALMAGALLWRDLPEPARDAIRHQRRAGGVARQSMAALGAQMVEIATTPRDLIWQEGRTTLWRYRPLGPRLEGVPPVLLCHGLIGRQTMTDLRPERSLVRNLLASGIDVLVVDWGNAGPEDQGLGLDHFIGRMIPALIDAGTAHCGTDQLVLFGICQGGTLAACHAARDPSRLAGLITAVAPFDFHADTQDADPAHGLMNLWARSFSAEDVNALIDMEGNLSGEIMGAVFHQLNPIRTLAKYAIEMLDTALDPQAMTTFIAMENWLMDRPDLPGRLAQEWLVDLYQENALAEGQLEIAGQPVDLSTIRMPVLNIFATADHIIPAPCAQALQRLAPDAGYQALALPTGHIGAFVSARSQPLLAPRIASWLTNLTL